MLSKFIVARFIKNHDQIGNPNVRNSYGYLGGIVGIIVNILLSIIKLSIGTIINSIAVTADAFNNLSDVASSVITMLGFKLASKPADEEHPFGHGRIEYLSALIVAFLVMLVGIQFIKSSFNRITNPTEIKFNTISFIIILISVLIKIWLSRFHNFLGKAINSSALKASSFDALSDVISSSVVALSLLLSLWITFPIDGYIGIFVSLFILYSGFSLIKETLNPLLGEAPDPMLVKNIKEAILKYDYITGVHDLIVHNYGPGRVIASIHAEVPCTEPILKLHEIIDEAEKELSSMYNIFIVIHMDPVNTNDKETIIVKEEFSNIINKFPEISSFHDLRIVGEGENKNIIFDVVINYSHKLDSKIELNLKKKINEEIKKIHPLYDTIITIDRDYANLDEVKD